MRDAVKYRMQWERQGMKVSTGTVHDVRTWANGKAFTHTEGCSREKRKGRKQARLAL
jgi:hypothetical protein